ncbi:MAG: LysM peptidoglycan-binding domain-containing protein [Chloroflexota bacterium]
MDLATLLTFIPLGIGIAWLFNLIFRKDLASQNLGSIISYFLGVLIIVLLVGYLIDNLLPSWLNNRVTSSRANVELREFINTVVVEPSTMTDGGTVQIVAPPTQVLVPEIVTPVPAGQNQPPVAGVADQPQNSVAGSGTHVVQPGETLTSIANRYGVDINVLRQVNNRVGSDYIYAGETLIIPAGGTTNPGK